MVTPGSYRNDQVLAQLVPDVAKLFRGGLRLGLTSQPIEGCEVRRDLTQVIASAYQALKTEIGDHYSAALLGGRVVPLVPLFNGDRAWAPGELFFRS